MKHILYILFSISCLPSTAQNWVQLTDFPGLATDDGTGFVIGDSAYFGTGLTSWWSPEKSFYCLDLNTETWSTIASLPNGEERQYASGFAFSNEGYVFGGYNGSAFLSDLWNYNPTTNEWTELSPLPDVGRSGTSCFVIEDTAYIIGGRTATNDAISEVWAYCISDDTWIQKSDLPFGTRWRSSTVSLNGLAYLTFGSDELGNFPQGLYEFNPAISTWQQLTVFPTIGRTHVGLFSTNDKLYISCGVDSLSNKHNDFWEYSLTQDEWTALPGIPSVGRKGGIALFKSDNFYYSTGIDESDQRLTETWKYDPSLFLESHSATEQDKKLIQIVDLLGRTTKRKANTIQIYIYSDGSTKKVYQAE